MPDNQLKRNSSKKSMDPRVIIGIAFAAVLIVAVIIVVVIFTGGDEKDAVSSELPSSSEVSSEAPSSEAPSSEAPSSEAPSSEAPSSKPVQVLRDETLWAKYEDAMDINLDSVGWISMPGINLSEPVLQSEDNKYYMDKDIYEKYAWEGSVFADYRNVFLPGKPMSTNTILYAHNKDNGTHFSNIIRYADDINMLKENPYIYLVTEETDRVYKIFSVMFTEENYWDFYFIGPEPSEFDGHCEMPEGFEDIEIPDYYDNILKQAKDRSLYDIDVDVNTDDKILSLVTCTYRFKTEPHEVTYSSGVTKTVDYREDVRFVIMARELRDGESIEDGAPKITVNADHVAPRFELLDGKKK